MDKKPKQKPSEAAVVGYKGFDKDLKCRGMQYAIGETFTHDGKAKLCSSGLHFCEYPLDVLGYYEPGTGSRYAEVEAADVATGKEEGGDSKRVAKSLHVKAEISFSALGGLAAKFIMDRADFTNKKVHQETPSSVASNSGDRSVASNSGYSSVASNSGYSSVASNSGAESCAISLGIDSTAKAAIGCWLTLSEWEYRNSDSLWHRIDVQTRKVDGNAIKADTLYKLVSGEFVEVK